MSAHPAAALEQSVRVPARGHVLEGVLATPPAARGLVLFAHGSGSSRHSPRNRYVASELRQAGFATLLFDLLTPDEEGIDRRTAALRFDVDLLEGRLAAAIRWAATRPETSDLAIGLFGASTGAAAALRAAAERPADVAAVVSRGGRPDLAGEALERVRAPVLLIVGGADEPVIELNQYALARLNCFKRLSIVPGATHLFEEPGALEEVARRAASWFDEYLPPRGAPGGRR